MKLKARLASNRALVGELEVLSEELEVLAVLPVLGKSDNDEAAKHGNPGRDTMRVYGDTPLGEGNE